MRRADAASSSWRKFTSFDTLSQSFEEDRNANKAMAPPAGDPFWCAGAAGGSNSAFTGDDMTGYTDWFPAAALEPMIEMEADRMQGLLLDPKVLESERGVIAPERRMSVENNNESILNEQEN
jgi:hypothetical protein